LFKEIQEAYNVLSDEEKKELYDRGGRAAVERGAAGGGGGGDLFSQLFGGGGGGRGGRPRERERKGEPTVQKLSVTLENLYKGRTFKMAISRQRVKYPPGMTAEQATTPCNTCRGQGRVIRVQRMGPMVQQVEAPCTDCKGLGRSLKDGVSTFQDKKQIEVRVEPGMKHGQKIVMSGEADEQPGLEPADIIFVLSQQEHAIFQRKGADLIMEKEISLCDALCGITFSFKHLDDREIIVKSKEGEIIKPNSLKQIAGEGMPRYKRPFEKGRLFVLFKVKFPTTLPGGAESIKLLKKALPQDPAPTPLPVGEHVETLDNPMLEATPDDFGKVGYSAETGNNAYESDDEEDGRGPGGGQRVQCANQ
jgi:DnaJ family protein A protein 2